MEGIKPFSLPNLKDVIHGEMSSSNWSQLVQHCQPVSNVSLVCRDGVVYTHKIVLASVSGFVKTLLSDIPVGDHVSVFMPDFFRKDVKEFLHDILLKSPNDNLDLQNHRRIWGGGRGGLGPLLEKLISLAGQKRELGRTEMGAWQDRNGKLGRR